MQGCQPNFTGDAGFYSQSAHGNEQLKHRALLAAALVVRDAPALRRTVQHDHG